MNQMMIEVKLPSKSYVLRLGLLLLVFITLSWGCSTWKHRISNKESQRISLSRQDAIKEQSLFMERQERELMNYFGESAMLVLSDGFRFHPDSGLIGKSAVLHYHTKSLTTARQQDSSVVAYGSEKHQKEKVMLKTEETKKQKRSIVMYWWVLLLIPVFWIIKKRRR